MQSFPVTLLSRPVFPIMPHAVDGREVQLVRGDASDVFSGATDVDTDEAIQNVQRSFQFLCTDRAEIAALRAFYRARKGRQQSFFYPTWRWEFSLCGYEEPNFGSFYLYLTHSRLLSAFTRNPKLGWFVISRGLGYNTHLVTSTAEIVENFAPGIDRVHMGELGESTASHAPLPPFFAGVAPPNETYRVHWMRYGRFDTDKLEFEYEGEDMATATLTLVETSDESPP